MIRAAVFNDTRPTNHHGCQLVMKALIDGLERAGTAATWFHPVRVDWREHPERLPRREDIDLVIVNGEGSIHHSATRPRAVYLPEIGPWAKSIGVPAFLINATISDIDRPTADAISAFDGVFVREDASRRELAGWGVDSEVCADLTVGLEFAARPRGGICVTDSVLKDSNRRLRGLANERGWEYRRMVAGANEPYEPVAALARAQAFTDWLSSHDLVVTGRFHTVTLCIATGTPFVAVESNTSKISAFVRDVFGDRRRVIGLDELKSLQADAWRWTAEEAANAQAAATAAREGQTRMFASMIAGLDRTA